MLHLLNLLFVAALLVLSITLEPGATGVGRHDWYLIPVIALLVTAVCYIGAAVLPGRPGLVNIPDRERFMSLSPEQQQPVIRRVQQLLHFTAMESAVVMGFIQLGLYHTPADGEMNGFILAGLAFALVAGPVVMFAYFGAIQAEVKRQSRTAEGPAGGMS